MDRNNDTVFYDRFQDCCPEKVYPLRNSLRKDVKQTDGEILSLQHYGKYLIIIPQLNRVSVEFGVMFKDKYVDLDMQHDLERSEVLNWCRTTKELFPIRTTADGNCLLHAVSQGMWGIEDTECLLRRVVYVNLVTDAKGMFKKRWIFHHRNSEDFQRVDVRLNTVDCCEEWEAVIKATDDVSKSQTHGLPYTALESIHLYVSANMLKRPIIVIADPMARTVFGQTIQDSQISGVYLPLEWLPEQCHKSPIVIGYNMNHFAPLMFEDAAGSNDTSIQAVPLVTKAMDSLPIRFLMPNEEMNIRNILSDYLHTTEVFYNTTTVPAVKVKIRTLPSELNVLEACLLDCERKFRRLMGEEVPVVNPQNEIVLQPFQFEVSKKAPKPAALADQRLNVVPKRDRHDHQHGGNRQKCVTIGCEYFANPETQNLCTKCFKDFTIQYARQEETARHMTGRQPFVPAQWISQNQLDPLGIPRPQPPARQGSENFQDLSIMGEDCHAGCGFKCSVETYPYCHECQPKYNATQQPRLEPPKQVESSIMPDKCNNPACKYQCSKATFPYCHACYDQFVAQPNVPPTAPPPSLPGIVGPDPRQAPIPRFSAAHTANASAGRSPQLSNETYSALQRTRDSEAGRQTEPMDVGSLDRPCKTVNCKNNAVKGNNGYCDNCYNLTLFGSLKCSSPGCQAVISVPESTQCLECFLKGDINQSGQLRSLTGGVPRELGLNIVPTPEQKILNSATSPELQLAGSLSGTSLRSIPTEHDETAGQHQASPLGAVGLQAQEEAKYQGSIQEKYICATPGCEGQRAEGHEYCHSCLRRAITTASSNNQQQKRSDLEESGTFPSCSPVPLSKEEMRCLNPVVVSSRDKVKCASPYCEKLIYPPKKLCDECTTYLEISKAGKSKTENLRSVGGIGEKCYTSGCQFFGLPDFNGYCSSCFKAQGPARVTLPLASRPQQTTSHSAPLASPTQPVSRTVPLAAKTAKGKHCIEKGCTRFGDPTQADRCSEHYEIAMAMFPPISAKSIEEAQRRVSSSQQTQKASRSVMVIGSATGPVLNRTVSENSRAGTSRNVVTGTAPVQEAINKPQTCIQEEDQFASSYDRLLQSKKIGSLCKNSSTTGCSNYGNSSKNGYCNTCFTQLRGTNGIKQNSF